jgi:hypothetical protein
MAPSHSLPKLPQAPSREDISATNSQDPWEAKSILRVLENRTYVGHMGDVPEGHDAIVSTDFFERAQRQIRQRRTRAPTPRKRTPRDPYLLRRRVRCLRCKRLMTTSANRALPDQASGRKRPAASPQRYYRCRGGPDSCQGTQVPAEELEKRALEWLRAPMGDLSDEAATVLRAYAPVWKVLFPESIAEATAYLVSEVRWDGTRDRFTVMLDDSAITEAHRELIRGDLERAAAKIYVQRRRKGRKR